MKQHHFLTYFLKKNSKGQLREIKNINGENKKPKERKPRYGIIRCQHDGAIITLRGPLNNVGAICSPCIERERMARLAS